MVDGSVSESPTGTKYFQEWFLGLQWIVPVMNAQKKCCFDWITRPKQNRRTNLTRQWMHISILNWIYQFLLKLQIWCTTFIAHVHTYTQLYSCWVSCVSAKISILFYFLYKLIHSLHVAEALIFALFFFSFFFCLNMKLCSWLMYSYVIEVKVFFFVA